MKRILGTLAVAATSITAAPLPLASPDLVFEEKDGILAFEAEHFCEQKLDEVRKWYLTTKDQVPRAGRDGDPTHIGGASGGAYLEILPDTRRNHGEKLIKGENFSNEPGKLAILSYKVHFNNPGKYYIWARAYSTTTEDNGFHVGLDGQWPESARRWQTVVKNRWHWESKQRTARVHAGERHKLFLEIEKPGPHTIHISMREDGIELDRLLFAKDRDHVPRGLGPKTRVKAGKLPKQFPMVDDAVPVKKPDAGRFPAHWGDPPAIQTKDYVPLPGGYGHGSSTLKAWIEKNMAADAKKRNVAELSKTSASSVEPLRAREEKKPSAAKRPRRPALHGPRGEDGNGAVTIHRELKQWHKVTLDLDGPYAHELDRDPNPFTDYRFTVTFIHQSGSPRYEVPGYFAADGNAAESSAQAGTIWRAHVSPDKPGNWAYFTSMTSGPDAAIGTPEKAKVPDRYRRQGSFTVAPTDKTGRDFRAHGRLTYVGRNHLQFAGSKKHFLKAGADAPETFLACADFDGTEARKPEKAPLKTWKAHVKDWKPGDPAWNNGKGKGIIGALNYLAGTGANVFSFLPYNAGGDGDNVWPFAAYGEKFHYDCSKLDQWEIVFSHADALGLYLHFKLQETEMDDNRRGGHKGSTHGKVPASLDGGDLGPERKLYCREMVARFGHHLALNWNLGEENTQTTTQQLDMAGYLRELDPYDHNVVVHTFPNEHEKVYGALLGKKSFTGISMQNSNVKDCHHQVVQWVERSRNAGQPWAVAFDEPGDAQLGMPPDPDYPGMPEDYKGPTIHDVRKYTLWGTLLAGGTGVEYYFGYKLPQNDLVCEDWRSRAKSWEYARIALEFFDKEKIPFWEMRNRDELAANPKHDNSVYCYAKKGLYLVYLPEGGTKELRLLDGDRVSTVQWFNPRNGSLGKKTPLAAGSRRLPLTAPGKDDWLAILR